MDQRAAIEEARSLLASDGFAEGGLVHVFGPPVDPMKLDERMCTTEPGIKSVVFHAGASSYGPGDWACFDCGHGLLMEDDDVPPS